MTRSSASSRSSSTASTLARVPANSGASGASHLWPDTARFSDSAIALAGVDLADLARRYGTPLYVYDAATIRSAMRAYRAAFAPFAPVRIGYSVKACGLLGVLALFRGGHASVASLGELDAAVAAGLLARRAWLHGNAKSDAELRGALALGIGRVVIDGEGEVGRLAALVGRRRQEVWLRVSPDIVADTHAHLRTAGAGQKFGLPLAHGDALRVARRIAATPSLRLVGVHAHVGSQIRDLETFERIAESLVGFARDARRELGLCLTELCVGGGLAAPESRDDPPPALDAYARAASVGIRTAADLGAVTIVVEPGRSLVGRAAIALYRVLERKELAGGRTFVSVDGGMGDNIRPALYRARYEAALVSRPLAPAEERVAIAGAYCEAGDLLIEETRLARASVGELVAIPAVGAYAVAMSSTYNHRPRPAVVLVDRAQAALIRRRERIADLLRLERVPATVAGVARRGRGSRAG